MQQCGISTEGAMAFQPVLKFNTTITVLDLRLNPLIGKCNTVTGILIDTVKSPMSGHPQAFVYLGRNFTKCPLTSGVH